MVESLKKLTVSYGAFSCTLEGFDDPFPVMKQVVDYFQNLADSDPGFGAHPERPDAEYLRNLAQQSAGAENVQAEVHEGGVILRQSSEAASDFEGMDVVEETVVVTPTAFQPKTDETEAVSEDVNEETETGSDEEIPLEDVAESEDFADAWSEPEYEEYEEEEEHELETPDLAEASEVADLIDADPLPEIAESDLAAIDEMAALHADMERFDAEPVVDTAPMAAELPDILKSDRETAGDTAPAFEDFPGVSDEDLAATEREMMEMALDTGDVSSPEIIEANDEPETIEEAAEEPKEKSGLVSKLPNWAAGLIRPSAGNDMNDDLGVVDLGVDGSEPEVADAELNGTTATDGLDPEDAALERLLKVTESRRIEPDATSDADALSEIREGILGMNPNPELTEDISTAFESPDTENGSETEDALDDTISLDDTADISEPDEADVELSVSDDDASEMNEEKEAATADDEAVIEDAHQEDEVHIADISNDAPAVETASAPTLEKPVKVLEPLQLTTAFKVSDVVAEEVIQEVASEELAVEETSSDFGTAESDELVLSSEEAEDEEEVTQERGAFRLVHDRASTEGETEADTAELPGGAEGIADDDLSLAIFASKVGAASLPELLEASAAYTTIVAGQTRFSRRSIMGMVDEMNTERNFSQEARIKSFGKLIRSGTILRVEDGQFAISRSAKFDYEMKIGA